MPNWAHSDVVLPVLVMGDSGIGKSRLLDGLQRHDPPVTAGCPTIGLEVRICRESVLGVALKWLLWDAGGQCRCVCASVRPSSRFDLSMSIGHHEVSFGGTTCGVCTDFVASFATTMGARLLDCLCFAVINGEPSMLHVA